MIKRAHSNALHKAFYNPTSKYAFKGKYRLLQFAKAHQIPPVALTEWLQQQPAYVLHKPIVRKFKRSKIYAPFKDALWEADLTYVDLLQKWNDKVKYLLCVIDVFSKRAAVEPIKRKTAEETAAAFKRIVSRLRAVPHMLRTDNGKEFVGGPFRNLMNTLNIHHYQTYEDDIKAGVVERFNRTIKSLIYKYMTAMRTRRYITHLHDLVRSYNLSYHRSIGMAPNQVNNANKAQVYNRLYGSEKNLTATQTPKFVVGDTVIVTTPWTKFRHGYTELWKRELFTIVDIKKHWPYRYVLADKQGNTIKGTFYAQELQKVSENIDI